MSEIEEETTKTLFIEIKIKYKEVSAIEHIFNTVEPTINSYCNDCNYLKILNKKTDTKIKYKYGAIYQQLSPYYLCILHNKSLYNNRLSQTIYRTSVCLDEEPSDKNEKFLSTLGLDDNIITLLHKIRASDNLCKSCSHINNKIKNCDIFKTKLIPTKTDGFKRCKKCLKSELK